MMGNIVLPLLWNLRKHWKLLGLTALALFVGIYVLTLKGEVRRERKLREHAEAKVQLILQAEAAATARAEEIKRSTEARYAQIQKEQANALTLARADADARLKRWMRDNAAQGGASRTDLPGAANPATGPDELPGAALVALGDLQRCNAAFVTAEGWQRWWREVEKAQPK